MNLLLKYTWKELGYALILVLILQGNLFIKLFFISILLICNLDKVLSKSINKSAFFYFYILATIIISVLTIGWLHRFNYIFSLAFSFLIWFFCLFLFNYNSEQIKRNTVTSIRNVLEIIFWVNVFFSFGQLVLLMIEQRNLNPFGGTHKASTGDFIYGIFSNSSVNMIISTFFFFYYYNERKFLKSIVAGVVAVLTTYMGGLILAIGAFLIILVLSPAIKFKYKIFGVLLLVAAYFAFQFVSPENMRYVKNNIKMTLSKRPPRKVISFVETYKHGTSNVPRFLFGSGPGNFSSRTAFVLGGEYVSWLPEKFIYRSPDFSANHFQLWNKKVLAIPYNDGTANQPFSLYNQLFGEYGIIGLFMFVIFYLGYYIKKYYSLTYGKYILIFMLLIFIMDYWFEYLSVVVLFEFFMLLQTKELNEESKLVQA